MFYLASTRFNNETYKENINYRKKKNYDVIYGTCVRIQIKYSLDTIMFVIEMNNATNKIEGIGIIRNRISDDKHKIYSNIDYNRYIYIGDYWMSRQQILNSNDSELVEIFDTILFKGKSHVKRHAGISVLTKKLLTNWNYELTDLEQRVKNLFIKEFRKDVKSINNNISNIIIDIDTNNNENIDTNTNINHLYKKTISNEIEFIVEE
jgi:hypothetical protein